MSRYRTTMSELMKKVYKEDGHQDVSSSKRMCKTIVEDAQQIESKLNSMSPEESLDTWWTNKLAVSANNLNKARDYIVNDIKEARIISDISGVSIPKLKKEVQPFNVKVDRVGPGMDSDYEVEFTGSEPNLIKYAKKHLDFDGNNFSQLKKHLAMEDTDITEVSDKLKLKVLAKKIKDFKDKAFKKVMPVKSPLFADMEEGRMKDIFTADQEGKSAEEIAKHLNIPVKTVKDILGEAGIKPYVSMQRDSKTNKMMYHVLDRDEKTIMKTPDEKKAMEFLRKNYGRLRTGNYNIIGEQLDEKIADKIIKDLQKAYAPLKGKTISPEMANKLSKHLDGSSYDLDTLRQLVKAQIPFVSTLARNKIYKKTGKFEEVEQPMSKEEPKKDDKKESENKDATIASLKDQITLLKQKLENEKHKAVKPEPNPDTGEVPLTVGVAYKHFKDKEKKEVKEETLEEMDKKEREKRLQRAKDMIKYYDMMKKKALKGPHKDLAKKMLKNDIEESTKPTEFKVKMKTSSGMKTVNVTVPVKNFKVDMAAIEDAARKKVKGDMVDFDFKGDMKEADLSKSQIKQVHKMADELPKKDFKDRYGKEKGDAVRYATATKMVKKKLGIEENTSAFNPTVHNKTLGVTTKDLDRAFKKLSNQAQTYVNELLRTGMGTRDAIKKAKQKFNENNISEDRRLYVETIAGLKKKAEKSGMPYSILKKVYDRGMAAWKSGHRPGASQQQWAFARVNSFVTKSSGTWGGADKDLAAKVRGSK